MKFRKCLIFIPFIIAACGHDGDSTIEYLYDPPEKGGTWEVSSLTKEGIKEDPIVDLTNAILKNDYTDIHSMLIVKNGKLIYEEYFNGFSSDDLHVLFSTTKSYSSTLIGIAIDQGYIESVDVPIVRFFDDQQGTFVDGKESITLKNLLMMTSGLEWDEWTTSGLSIENSHEQMMQAESQLGFVIDLPLVDDPGSVFTYNTGLSNLMAPIVESATHMDIEAFTNKYLFSKLHIEDYKWARVIDSLPSTGGSRGGIEMKPRDMVKLGQLVLNEGSWNGSQVVSKNWLEEALSARVNQSENINYGFQWWNRTYFRKSGQEVLEYDAVGDGGQWVFVFPEYDLVVGFTGGNYTWIKGPDLMFQPINMVQNFILPAII